MYTSEKGNPLTRALELRRLIGKIDLSDADVVILGFLPQLLISSLGKELTKGACSTGKRPVIVAEMFLSLYDTVILDRHLFEDGKKLSAYLRKMDKKTIEAADLVVTDTKANADYLALLYEADEGKFETLYLEADKEIYTPGSTDADKVVKEIESLGTGNDEGSTDKKKCKVLYFGSGLPLQGTDVVLEAFNRVRAESDDFSFLFVGGLKGIPRSEIKKAKADSGIELTDWLLQEDLAVKIAKADLCIAGHFNAYIGKADRTIPGKAYIYELMKKPMILGDTRANREIFSEDRRHFFVKRGSPEELAECIKRFQL